MQPVITAEQMRTIDRLTVEKAEITSLQLMQRAAHACFHAIDAHFPRGLAGKKVLVLCGPGNNGGDGAALAQELIRAGCAVDVVLLGSVANTRGDAYANLEIVRDLAASSAASLTFVECHTASDWEAVAVRTQTFDVIVDALFGTGLKRPLAGIFAEAANHLATLRHSEKTSGSASLIVSVDLPSGLNADSANPIGPVVNADLTVTFTAPKPANVLPPASHLNGTLIVADIGSPSALIDAADSQLFVIEEVDARKWLRSTRYIPDSFKNSHGHVLLIAGSRGYTGAAVLSGNAAMQSGAGLVTIATPSSAQSSVAATAMPEVMTIALAETDRGAISDDAVEHVLRLASRATVTAIGPGLSSDDERTRRFVREVVKQRKTPIVIDADGLNCLAPWPSDLQRPAEFPLILTPHPGEMLRLMGTTDKSALDDSVAAAREFATNHHLILVLKGSRSLIAAPDGRVFITPTGSAGLGTAGAGDTLTGIIAGFIAQGAAGASGGFFDEADALFGVIAALFIGGLAGDFAARDLGMRAMVASDICEYLSEAFLALDPAGELP